MIETYRLSPSGWYAKLDIDRWRLYHANDESYSRGYFKGHYIYLNTAASFTADDLFEIALIMYQIDCLTK